MGQGKALSLAGIVAPPLYILTIVVIGWLRPDYSFVPNVISQLTEPRTPYQPVLTATFSAYNFLSFMFAFRLAQVVAGSPNCRARGLLAAAGVAVVGICGAVRVGFFPMDPLGAPPGQGGWMHTVMVAVSSIAAIVALFTFGSWGACAGRGARPGRYSTVSGWVLVAAILNAGAAIYLLKSRWMGLAEKAAVIAYLQWMFVMAMRLYPSR